MTAYRKAYTQALFVLKNKHKDEFNQIKADLIAKAKPQEVKKPEVKKEVAKPVVKK